MSEQPVFQAGTPHNDPPPRKSKRAKQAKRRSDEDGSLVGDIAEEAGGCLLEGLIEGCLWRVLTLPFRFIGWIVKAIFD